MSEIPSARATSCTRLLNMPLAYLLELHCRLQAGLGHFLQPYGVNARILVFVFDLTATFFHAEIDLAFTPALCVQERVPPAADADRQISRPSRADIEML